MFKFVSSLFGPLLCRELFTALLRKLYIPAIATAAAGGVAVGGSTAAAAGTTTVAAASSAGGAAAGASGLGSSAAPSPATIVGLRLS